MSRRFLRWASSEECGSTRLPEGNQPNFRNLSLLLIGDLMKITRTSGAVVVASTLLLVSIAGFMSESSHAEADSQKEAVADAKGSLQVPRDYSTQYQFLGTWSVADDQGQGAKQLHEVYASPGVVEAYRKDGHFPDGSILVKEVYQVKSGSCWINGLGLR